MNRVLKTEESAKRLVETLRNGSSLSDFLKQFSEDTAHYGWCSLRAREHYRDALIKELEGWQLTNGNGLEERLERLEGSAYGVRKPIRSVLEAMTDEEIEQTFEAVLEELLQEGRELR
jgi:hypothetical protein